MTDIRLAVWNMEWLNNLFTTDDNDDVIFKPDDEDGDRSGKHTVGERKALIGSGLVHIDADLVVVVEGPNKTEELQLLFDELAPGDWTTYIQVSKSINGPGRTDVWSSSQCVGIAVRTDRGKFAADPMQVFDSMDQASGAIFEASEPFWMDTGNDKIPEWYRFERRPAYAEITLENDAKFRVMGVHLKSKGIFSAHEWSRWWAMADANRERLVAQCRRVREAFIEPYLTDDATKDIPLIVCGDINDGPGFDTSEMKLKSSGVETLMGSVWRPYLTLGNALYDRLSDKDKAALNFEDNSTTSFADPIFNRTYHRVWIDHIVYSLNADEGWVHDADILRKVGDDGPPYYTISDHFPVVATVTL
ncbi:MAG: endonuclease/exonuclease/phosphatase family protein [Parasphingopyxis sp.]|uniref:endonuclease/exonuclease/phosphatase family protein n=1 Tax=Parasphingopyxis sp. TaxID=1920299 RepID=UPI003F9F4361